MAEHVNAVAPNNFDSNIPELPKPQKNRKGHDVKEYGPEEVHPSDAYKANIGNLIERPNSAPISKYRAPTPSNQRLTAAYLTAHNTGTQGLLASIISYLNTIPAPAVTPFPGPSSTASSENGPDSAPDRVESMAFVVNDVHLQPVSRGTIFDFRSALDSAQHLYGPRARVVVGNLPNFFFDGVLSEIVQHSFAEYGVCFACVFRGEGEKGFLRPYAIVQYTKEMDALAAFFCGQEKMIMGRKARVELSHFA